MHIKFYAAKSKERRISLFPHVVLWRDMSFHAELGPVRKGLLGQNAPILWVAFSVLVHSNLFLLYPHPSFGDSRVRVRVRVCVASRTSNPFG